MWFWDMQRWVHNCKRSRVSSAFEVLSGRVFAFRVSPAKGELIGRASELAKLNTDTDTYHLESILRHADRSRPIYHPSRGQGRHCPLVWLEMGEIWACCPTHFTEHCKKCSQHVFSECEREFTFTICCRPSVRLSSVCLSVTLVHPTQAVVIFGNISTAFGMLATTDIHEKFFGDRPRGYPSVID